MGWDRELFDVFDELEHRAEALHDLQRAPELADRSRAAYAAVTLASRLMATVGEVVELDALGVGPVRGALQRVAAEWCLVSGSGGQDWVLPLASVTVVHGASARSVPEVAWSPMARLGLGSALRRIADSGQRCMLHLRDGTAYAVVLRRVGADFMEVDGVRAAALLVPFAAVGAVQSREG